MKTLSDLVKASHSAQLALTYLALRDRHRKEPTRISRFKKTLKQAGIDTKIEDLYTLFQGLEALGHGELKYSRKLPFIFVWKDDYRDVAAAALEEADVRPKLPLTKSMPSIIKNRTIVFVLAGGKTGTLELPSDINKKDLTSLVESLKNLHM